MENGVRNRKVGSEGEEEEIEPLLSKSDEKQKIFTQNGNTNNHQNSTSPQAKQFEHHVVPLHFKTLRATLYVACKALNILYIPMFIYRAFEKRNRCTPVTDPLLRIPAVELARKIRRKELSCQEVVQAYINRIKEVNPLLNAVIEDRFAEALEDAKRVDALVASEDFLKDEDQVIRNYPLLGVPVSIKGSLAVNGLKHTSGTVTRKEVRADYDADAVRLVKEAGAIPLLVSNVPELCMSWETTNKLTGTTTNPHDTTRTCGGSSGGEASLLAAGASVIGLGSDVAGSLRLPAHYCGIWGHKPTPGVVSYAGHYPSCLHQDKWDSVFTVGPMARYATDLRVLLNVMAVPEKRAALDLSKKIDVKTIKVYYSEYEDYYWQKPNRHCSGAVRKVIDHLGNICDKKPKDVDFHVSLNYPDLMSLHVLTIEDIDDLFDGNSNGVFAELFRYTTFRSRHTFMAIACGLLRKLAISLTDKQKQGLNKIVAQLKKEYEDILGRDGVIVVPSFPTEAPKHGDVLKTAILAGYQTMFNALGYTVTNCPVGVTKEGLPVGIQVASLPYNDKLTLAVAEEIERVFGGWIEPKSS